MYTVDDIDEERSHIRTLIAESKRRLRPLEVQRVKFGVRTDPHIINEIDDIKAEISLLDKKEALLSDMLRVLVQRITKEEILYHYEQKRNEILSNVPSDIANALGKWKYLDSIGLLEEYKLNGGIIFDCRKEIDILNNRLSEMMKSYRKM
jgi:hypothetical protein